MIVGVDIDRISTLFDAKYNKNNIICSNTRIIENLAHCCRVQVFFDMIQSRVVKHKNSTLITFHSDKEKILFRHKHNKYNNQSIYFNSLLYLNRSFL